MSHSPLYILLPFLFGFTGHLLFFLFLHTQGQLVTEQTCWFLMVVGRFSFYFISFTVPTANRQFDRLHENRGKVYLGSQALPSITMPLETAAAQSLPLHREIRPPDRATRPHSLWRIRHTRDSKWRTLSAPPPLESGSSSNSCKDFSYTLVDAIYYCKNTEK